MDFKKSFLFIALSKTTWYNFLISELGCVNFLDKSPSLVSNNNPVVFLSNLPTGYNRFFEAFEIKSITVFLPLSSIVVVMNPFGLFNKI